MVALTITLSAMSALIAGVIILIWPKALNIAVALWLILNGILQFVSGL